MGSGRRPGARRPGRRCGRRIAGARESPIRWRRWRAWRGAGCDELRRRRMPGGRHHRVHREDVDQGHSHVAAAPGRSASRLHANRENFNTEIGLPLTVLEAPRDTELMVLEMAMRGMGQIRELAQIARPRGGRDHQRRAGAPGAGRDVERVAEAKAELIAELAARRRVRRARPAEEALRPHLRSRRARRSRSGSPSDRRAAADVRRCGRAARRTACAPRSPPEPSAQHFEFGFTQAHNLANALAAIGAAHALGRPARRACARERAACASRACAARRSSSGRRSHHQRLLQREPDIDAGCRRPPRRGRRPPRDARRAVAVLGRHARAGQLGGGLPPRGRRAGGAARVWTLLVAVGEHGRRLRRGLRRRRRGAPRRDAERPRRWCRDLLEEGDVVLVKGVARSRPGAGRAGARIVTLSRSARWARS